MKLFVLFDNVAEKAGPVFEQDTVESSKRACAAIKFPPGTKANDFNLLCVGEIGRDGNINPAYSLIATLPAEDVPL